MWILRQKSLLELKFSTVFLDEYAKFVISVLFGQRSEELASLRKFVPSVETPKKLRQDNAKKFKSQLYNMYCLDAGILQKKSIPETPWQDRLAEKMPQDTTEYIKMLAHWLGTPQDDVGSSNSSNRKHQKFRCETRRRKMRSRADARYKT